MLILLDLWLNWWINGNGARTTLFAVIYLLLGVLNLLGIAGYAWYVSYKRE